MPAHLTLLYPFVPPAKMDRATLSRLEAASTGLRSFDAEFDDFGWFADQVLWLAPSRPEPFENLISRLTDALPEFPPCGGAIRPQLPLKSRVASLSLMTGSMEPGSWHVVERVALGR